MANSLLLATTGELLPSDPNAVGCHLLIEYDLGDPATITAAVEALLLDGERVTSTRSGNRSIVLPILVRGSSRLNMSARVDALIHDVAAAEYTLTWEPDGGLPLIWDCMVGQATVRWDVQIEDRFCQRVDLTLPALPFGRSPDPVTPTLTEVDNGSGWVRYALSDLLGSARAPVNVELGFASAIDAWLLHRPPADADPGAPIATELTSGAADIADAELLRGTYSVVLGIGTYGAPGQDRIVTVTFTQDDTTVTQTISKAYTSALNLRHLEAGKITLPLVDRPAGASSGLSVTVEDSGDSTFYALFLLDTRGHTVQALSQADGTADSVAAWIDEPGIGQAIGPMWSSSTATRTDAFAITEPRVSGGPMSLSADDEDGVLLVYAAGALPDEPVIGYHPRWLAERVE